MVPGCEQREVVARAVQNKTSGPILTRGQDDDGYKANA